MKSYYGWVGEHTSVHRYEYEPTVYYSEGHSFTVAKTMILQRDQVQPMTRALWGSTLSTEYREWFRKVAHRVRRKRHFSSFTTIIVIGLIQKRAATTPSG